MTQHLDPWELFADDEWEVDSGAAGPEPTAGVGAPPVGREPAEGGVR